LGAGKRRLHAIPGLPPRADEPLAGCAFAGRCHIASDACRQAPIPLDRLEQQRAVRCIHRGEHGLSGTEGAAA
ncbi:MAG: oligopeptide/dipeptide ABC transporter ATP-binding protein, partial [Alphaproteobacteria bacterium]